MNCKICNSENNNIIQHKVYKCADCGHTFINYTDDGIKYHKILYRKPGEEGARGDKEVQDGIFTKTFHERRAKICNSRVKFIEHLFPKCTSILDIGAGGGTFLNLIRNRFDLVEATEVSDLCADNLLRDGYKVYHGAFTKLTIPNTYDLVTCWHVLEHIEDIKAFPIAAAAVTNKYLVIEVPINRRLRNPDKNFDGHFHYFSEDSFTRLFENLFKILYIRKGIQVPAIFAILEKL